MGVETRGRQQNGVLFEFTLQYSIVIYLKVVLEKTPENFFLGICELDGQDALSVKKSIIESLFKYGFIEEYLPKHLIALANDGASVMLGCKSGVGTVPKKDFPSIILWHYLDHRLDMLGLNV